MAEKLTKYKLENGWALTATAQSLLCALYSGSLHNPVKEFRSIDEEAGARRGEVTCLRTHN